MTRINNVFCLIEDTIKKWWTEYFGPFLKRIYATIIGILVLITLPLWIIPHIIYRKINNK